MNTEEIFQRELRSLLGENGVLTDEPMSRHTTFRTGGAAQYYVQPTAGQLPQVLACCRRMGVPCLVIGNGSNLLCGDLGVEGVVAEIGKPMSAVTIEGDRITAQAGALLSGIAAKAAGAGLTGFEFASGIPGSLGGAVVMNAGAYGGEMKDVLLSADVLTPQGDVITLPAAELSLAYRHSCVPERGYIVLGAVLQLTKGDKEAILAKMEELRVQRTSKQPLEYPSAGSTFKRPEGYFAGKLIQDAGLRGYSCGGAQVSEKHCGFVINRDHATSADVCILIEEIQKQVAKQFGVQLETEIRFVGKFR